MEHEQVNGSVLRMLLLLFLPTLPQQQHSLFPHARNTITHRHEQLHYRASRWLSSRNGPSGSCHCRGERSTVQVFCMYGMVALVRTVGFTDPLHSSSLRFFADRHVCSRCSVSLGSTMRLSDEIPNDCKISPNAEAKRGCQVAEKTMDSNLHEKLNCSSSESVDQLVVAADIWFVTKWQRSCHESPTARQDAESAECSRWINLLADVLRHTDTPSGRLLWENPANSQLLWREPESCVLFVSRARSRISPNLIDAEACEVARSGATLEATH